MFNNAEIEFDYFLEYGPDRVGIPFSSEIKGSAITKEQLDKFKSLLEKLDSENLKSQYTPTQGIIDSHITVTVSYESRTGMKQIILEENDSHLNLEKTNIYPSSLIKLMELVYQIYYDNRKQFLEKNKDK